MPKSHILKVSEKIVGCRISSPFLIIRYCSILFHDLNCMVLSSLKLSFQRKHSPPSMLRILCQSRNNPQKRIIPTKIMIKDKKLVRKHDNSTCNQFSLIRHWTHTCTTDQTLDPYLQYINILWIKLKIALIKAKCCDKNALKNAYMV